MKRTISLLLTVIMILCLVPLNAITAFATNTAKIKVENVSATPNSTVDVAISITDNPGIASIGLTLSFDEALTLIGASNGEAFSELTMTPPAQLKKNGSVSGSCRFAWLGNENASDDGIILNLKFKVSENAELNKDCAISLVCESGDVLDEARNTVDVTTENGKINVIDYTPGDVDGTGTINMMDVLTLCQYYVDGCQYDPDGYAINLNPECGDVDANGKVNMMDVLMICQYYVDGCKYDPDGYAVRLMPGKKSCDHTMEHTVAKSATCTEDGNIEYWYCSKCGEYFSDVNGLNTLAFNQIVIQATGHSFSSVWSSDEQNHWHGANCGHTVTSDYGSHDFDSNGFCTICGYKKQQTSYKDQYTQYSEIGKTIDLINADDIKISSGTKRVFSDELYYSPLNCYDEGNQESTSNYYSELSDYTSDFSAKVDLKVSFGSRTNKNGSFLTNKLPSIDVGLSGAYEKKKTSETSEFIYAYNYIMNGQRVEISEFKNLSKLSSMISPELIADARKIKTGAMSAEEFIHSWGTHVVTSAIYGSKVDVNYYQIDTGVTDYTAWQASLQAEFSQRFLKTGLDVSVGAGASQITTSSDKTSIKKLSIKVKSKSALASNSLDGFQSQYSSWLNNYNPNTDSVLVDIGGSGLCCVWYLLDDSFNDVKEILDEYMNNQCSELYRQYLDKMNSLKIEDDVAFNKDTETLKLNIGYYQKAQNISNFASNNYVSYENGILNITPYYGGNQIKCIEIVGAYGTYDDSGFIIDNLISDVSINLATGNWYKNLKVVLKNCGIETTEDHSFIDLTGIDNSGNVIIEFLGSNLIQAKDRSSDELAEATIKGNNITIKSTDKDSVLTVYGAKGKDGSTYGECGIDGGCAIIAKNTKVDTVGNLILISGNGGDGYKGKDGNNGTTKGSYKEIDKWYGFLGAHIATIYRYDAATNGETGENGGNGGNAGIPIEGLVDFNGAGIMTIVYGNGGNGANGGNGGAGGNGHNYYSESSGIAFLASYRPGNGGDGGDGGLGGVGGLSNTKNYSFGSNNVIVQSGLNGANGNGGDGGTGGKGGTGGTGTAGANVTDVAGNAANGTDGNPG